MHSANSSFPLENSLRLGSQLFVNPDDSAELLREKIATLDEAGFKLIRLFMVWNQLEPVEGRYVWTPYQEIFDEAAERGMGVIPTLMSVSPPGWMNLTQGLQEAADLDDPAFLEKSLSHLREVVKHFRNHPGLDSWILWNEPGRSISPSSPHAVRAFRKYLKNLHGDIKTYNACHFRPASSFDDIQVSQNDLSGGGFVSHRNKLEWLHFTIENLQSYLKLFAGEVRQLDPDHPIHVNPHRVSQCLADTGQSMWREADLVDFVGCSSHPAWHSCRFQRKDYGTSVAMFADLSRSATRAAKDYFWVTELQGGSTLFSAFEPLTASPAEARLWLWQSLAAGAKAVVYWCANARNDGYEAGEWDLLNFRGKPTPQLQEISATWKKILPHQKLLASAFSPVPDIAILLSEESQVLDMVEGTDDLPANPRNSQRGSDAVSGAYLLCARSSLETVFYNFDRFLETPLDRIPPVILLPDLKVVSTPVLHKLKEAVVAGKRVIADGLFAWKGGFGNLAPAEQQLSDELWGLTCSGYEAVSDSESWKADDGVELPAFFCRAIFEPGTAKATAHWPDGRAAAIESLSGKGSAYRIGTSYFQKYFLHSDDDFILKHFQELAGPDVSPSIYLEKSVRDVRLRRLQTPDGEIAIVINSTSSPVKAVVIERKSGKKQPLDIPSMDAVLISFITT